MRLCQCFDYLVISKRGYESDRVRVRECDSDVVDRRNDATVSVHRLPSDNEGVI